LSRCTVAFALAGSAAAFSPMMSMDMGRRQVRVQFQFQFQFFTLKP